MQHIKMFQGQLVLFFVMPLDRHLKSNIQLGCSFVAETCCAGSAGNSRDLVTSLFMFEKSPQHPKNENIKPFSV